ncbi:polyketide synthase [Aspergillus luchuensis]|uniref:Polyketide synthase n=1 Tax=Aspergillus kawachii TaxID=1069201 RepID=A0A146F541_ASPKA|nr:polyketide synthase [Aspergillus luchuensis]
MAERSKALGSGYLITHVLRSIPSLERGVEFLHPTASIVTSHSTITDRSSSPAHKNSNNCPQTSIA